MDRVLKITLEDIQVYEQDIQRRREPITHQIANTLTEGGAGIQIMRKGKRIMLQFSSEINVTLVMLPVSNEIAR